MAHLKNIVSWMLTNKFVNIEIDDFRGGGRSEARRLEITEPFRLVVGWQSLSRHVSVALEFILYRLWWAEFGWPELFSWRRRAEN